MPSPKWIRTALHPLRNERGDLGGRADREKEAKRQEDIARQNEESQNILNQFLSQLVPGSEEFNRLQSEGTALVRATTGAGDQQDQIRQLGTQFVSAQQARIAGGGPATALEARTNRQVEGLRAAAAFSPEEQAVFQALRGEEPGSDLARIFQQILDRAGTDGTGLEAELARALRGESTTTPLGAQAARMVDIAGQDPDLAFTQELDLLQDRINREANARGLASSGLPLEQLGRAGVELAVRKATEREQIRRNREADVLDLLTRAQQGDQEALSNVQALFNTGQQLRGREIGVEEAVTNLQAGRESNLTSLLQSQTGNATQNLLELLSTQTGRAEGLRDLASALREAERQSREQFVGDLLLPEGTIDIGPFSIKTPSGGSAFPQGVPSISSTRGRPAGTDVASLLSAQQTPTGAAASQSQASTLSRRRNQDSEGLIAALLATLGGGS